MQQSEERCRGDSVARQHKREFSGDAQPRVDTAGQSPLHINLMLKFAQLTWDY